MSESTKTAWISTCGVITAALIAGIFSFLNRSEEPRPERLEASQEDAVDAFQMSSPAPSKTLASLVVGLEAGASVTIIVNSAKPGERRRVVAKIEQALEVDSELVLIPQPTLYRTECEPPSPHKEGVSFPILACEEVKEWAIDDDLNGSQAGYSIPLIDYAIVFDAQTQNAQLIAVKTGQIIKVMPLEL